MKIDENFLVRHSLTLGLGLLLPLTGCPADDTGTTVADESTTAGPSQTETTAGATAADTTAATDPTAGSETRGSESGTTGEPPGACPGAGVGAAADGDACTANADCASGVCTLYTDVPVNDDAVCAAAAEDCSTRVTGTVFDFRTREPIADATVIVAAALQAATNPTGAMALVEATSDAEGRIDATSSGPIAAPIGIVALTAAGGYFLTATGVAAPWEDGGSEYNVGTNIHDVWAVPETDLQDWSDELQMDAMIPAENLPLGDTGGVVGLVRDASGTPLANAVVSSTDDGSGAFIRYLADDGSFSTDRTSDLGIFVILEPALAEQFEVTVDGAVVGGGTAGSADGAIFTLIVNAG
jgi:hypothetical protein